MKTTNVTKIGFFISIVTIDPWCIALLFQIIFFSWRILMRL
jgi:hypothetical protein